MASGSSQVRKRQPVYVGTRRQDGLWQRTRADGSLAFELQQRQHGKVRRLTLQATNRSEAVREAAALRVDLDRGVIKAVDKQATTRQVFDLYFDHIEGRTKALDRRRKMSARTVGLYRQRLTLVLDHLPTRIGDCETAHIVRLVNVLEKKGRAPATIQGYLVATSALFDWARRSKFVSSNIVRQLEREDRPGVAAVKPKRFLGVDEVEALLALLSPESRPVAATMAYAGLRISESLGLTWGDLDFDSSTLTVSGQLGAKGERVLTKTASSEATLPMRPTLAAILLAHRRRVSETIGIQALGAERLVFTTKLGKPISRRNVHRALNGASERAGLGKLGAHDLRRACLSQMVDAGMSLLDAQKVGRHGSVAVTHRYLGSERTAQALGERLAAAGLG